MSFTSSTAATRAAPNAVREWEPDPEQTHGVRHLMTRRAAGLAAEPGSGKTSMTLTAFALLHEEKKAQRMLVIAPLRVCRHVWRQEGAKWAHLRHLRFVFLHGSKKDKLLKDALADGTEVFLVNPEGVRWLCNLYFGRQLPFDVVTIDELTRFKNAQSDRSKALRPRIDRVGYRWGLTGSLAPNGYMDLFGQQLVLDGGAALGRYITHYRDRYFQVGFDGFSYDLLPGSANAITERIAPTWRRMSAEGLPLLVERPHMLELGKAERATYTRMKNDFIATLPGGVVEAGNKAAAYSKLAQMANGAVYYAGREVAHLHDAKIDALDSIVEELAGEPVLIGYEFIHDRQRLDAWHQKRFGRPLSYLGDGQSEAKENDTIRRWNAGELPVLAAHPACVHPDTLVLTEHRGWQKIITVTGGERVFDGVEYVTHRGVAFSGVKPVIDCGGVICTPDHLFLVDGAWVEARHVRSDPRLTDAASHADPRDADAAGALPALRRGARAAEAACVSRQPGTPRALPDMPAGDVSQYDGLAPVPHLAGHGVTLHGPGLAGLAELRRAWDYGCAGVAALRGVLAGHAEWLRKRSDDRAREQHGQLLPSELLLGAEHGAAGEQAQQQACDVAGRPNAPCSVLPRGGRDARRDHAVSEAERLAGRRGDDRIQPEQLPALQSAPVVDIIDCGPRHRFMVKGADGRCFIVHNSAGHGLNMQEGSAAHLVWFGITWDFELFDQFIRRIRRRGNQAQRIFMHLLIVRGTIDEMKLTALGEKNMTQESLFGALKRILADGGAGEQEKVMVAKLTPRGGPPQGVAQGTAGGGWGGQPPQTAQGQREAIQENIQPRESVRGAFSGGTQAALDQVQRGDYGETAPQGGNAWGQGQQSAQNGPQGQQSAQNGPQGSSSWGQGGQQAAAQASPLPDPQQTQTAVEAPKRTRSRKAAEPEANGAPDAAAIRLELLRLIVPTDPAMSAEDLLDVCADLAEWVLTGERPS